MARVLRYLATEVVVIPLLALYEPQVLERFQGKAPMVRVTAITRDWGRCASIFRAPNFGGFLEARLSVHGDVDSVELAVWHRDEWQTVAGWSVGAKWDGDVTMTWAPLLRPRGIQNPRV